MKTKLWWGVVVIAGAFAVSPRLQAQTPAVRGAKIDFGRLIRSCERSLRSDYPGVVEGTMYNLIEYKSTFPDRDYSGIVKTLNDVARESSDPTIIYKATLTKMYLTFGTRIGDTSVFSPDDHARVFQVVAEQFEKQLLVSRID